MTEWNRIADEIEGGVRGEVMREPPERYCQDFARIVRRRPALVVTTTCEADVVHVLRVATASGVSVTVRGAGHSCAGQSLSDGGIVMANYRDQEIALVAGDRVEVTGRTSWSHLERELNRAGRSAPVLADYLKLSVGGTLSVGGVGINSIVHGLQVDQVESLRLVTRQGEAVDCSPRRNEQLFRFALAGLGQVGVIERVTMKTVPYRRYSHNLRRPHPSVADLVAFLRRAARPGSPVEHLQSYVNVDQIWSEYGFHADRPDADSPLPADLMDGVTAVSVEEDYPFALQARRDAWLDCFPDHVRMWTDYVFQDDGLDAFLGHIASLMVDQRLARALRHVYILAARRPAGATRFAFAPGPPGCLLYGIGLMTMIGRHDVALIAHVRAVLAPLLDRCAELGGRPYLYGAHPLDERLRERFYAAELAELSRMPLGPRDPR